MIRRPLRFLLFPYTTLFRSLQFCDLLSLYMCCGARENVILPKYFGIEVRVVHKDDSFKLDPAVIQSSEFSDRKSTRLNSSHTVISYAVFCLKKKSPKEAAIS